MLTAGQWPRYSYPDGMAGWIESVWPRNWTLAVDSDRKSDYPTINCIAKVKFFFFIFSETYYFFHTTINTNSSLVCNAFSQLQTMIPSSSDWPTVHRTWRHRWSTSSCVVNGQAQHLRVRRCSYSASITCHQRDTSLWLVQNRYWMFANSKCTGKVLDVRAIH